MGGVSGFLTSIGAVAALFLTACDGGGGDPRTVPGAIAAMAQSVERNDARAMFRLIDARSRHAMASIVSDRRAARALVASAYPEDTKAAALASLGDAATARDAADLFAARCDAACLREIGQRLGAPTGTRRDGDVTVVTTPRGELRLRGGGDDWFGLEWNAEALFDERERANRDLELIRQNAATYTRRRELGE